MIRAYRTYIDKRRSIRPEAEYREPTDEEWAGSDSTSTNANSSWAPAAGPTEHPANTNTCIRCPMLRVDPKQRDRIAEIIANLSDRIKEAELNDWLGEVAGLRTSRDAAVKKLTSLDRSTACPALREKVQRCRDGGRPRPSGYGVACLGRAWPPGQPTPASEAIGGCDPAHLRDCSNS